MSYSQNLKNILSGREKVGGEKGGGDFLFKADQREAALWLPLFPLSAAAIFFLLLFLLEVALHDRKLQRVL